MDNLRTDNKNPFRFQVFDPVACFEIKGARQFKAFRSPEIVRELSENSGVNTDVEVSERRPCR
jgi:hypothetical protein